MLPTKQKSVLITLSTVHVCFQDAEKMGFLIQLKTPELLENKYDLPASPEEVAQLQSQVLELQGELKECKTRNKQLHDKLILAEAMMEEMATPKPVLLNGEHQENVFFMSWVSSPQNCLKYYTCCSELC